MYSKNKLQQKTQNIKKKLIAKRKDIKSKLDILKDGQMVHENLFKPITKHLQNIESKLDRSKKKNKEKKLIKSISKSKIDDYQDALSDNSDLDLNFQDDDKVSVISEPLPFTSSPIEYNTPKGELNTSASTSAPQLKRKLFLATSSTPKDLRKQIIKGARKKIIKDDVQLQNDYEHKLNKTILEKSISDYEDQYHALPLKYIKRFVDDPSDGKFRVKYDKKIEAFSIGNKRINFNGPDLIIGGKTYKGTKGLYGLLFNKNVPSEYTKQDENAYFSILQKTNALRKNFNPNLELITSKNMKYKKLVEPLLTYEYNTKSDLESESDDNDAGDEKEANDLQSNKEGQGLLMEVSSNKTDHIYWDDPNELIDRLKLLLASQTAGNTGLRNEINSIIEELQEANIIE